jgi:hypothetical protein
MNRKQIKSANVAYNEMFGTDMSPEANEIAKKVKSVDDLYTYPNDQVLSDGELDCLEGEL